MKPSLDIVTSQRLEVRLYRLVAWSVKRLLIAALSSFAGLYECNYYAFPPYTRNETEMIDT